MSKVKKDFQLPLLLDFYGEMLTEKQREVFTGYYNEDLSLAEIAAVEGISRQGVRDSIKRAERQLIGLEEKLGLYARFHDIVEELGKIEKLCSEIKEENLRSASSAIINAKTERILEIVSDINI